MTALDLEIVTPGPLGARTGNRITALRWAKRLRELGHRAAVVEHYSGEAIDGLIALHAVKSADSISSCRERSPQTPIAVALTGTDLYGGAEMEPAAARSLEIASAIVVLQPLALEKLAEPLRAKARVIHQSARPVPRAEAPREDVFEVLLVANLRPVKDPLLAARAVRRLPFASRIRVAHCGAALDEGLRRRAVRESAENPRYAWLGLRPRREVLQRIASSRALLVTSSAEGGANTVSEAVVNDRVVLSTRIDGSIGLLGEDYPGYFEIGDDRGLALLLERLERDPGLREELERACARRKPLFDPARERAAWAELIAPWSK